MSENQTGALLVRLTREDIEALLEGVRLSLSDDEITWGCIGCQHEDDGCGIRHAPNCTEIARVEAARDALRVEHLTVAAVMSATKERPQLSACGSEWDPSTGVWTCSDCGSQGPWDHARHAPDCPTLLKQAEDDATVAKLRRLAGEVG